MAGVSSGGGNGGNGFGRVMSVEMAGAWGGAGAGNSFTEPPWSMVA